MPTVLSSSLRHKNLNNFRNTIQDESVYFFVSKPTSWAGGDLTPPSVFDTFTLEPEAHDEMLYLKRVSVSNCVNVIRLYRWQENRRYQAYSDKVDLSDLLTKRTISTNEYYPFYVVNDDFRVYKCIDNGATTSDPNGVSSTVEPTTVAFTGSDTYTPLSDGYIWKYMFTLRPIDASEFLTTDWFPIRTLSEDDGTDNWDIITNAVSGGVYNIKVTNAGSSYTNILPATDNLNTTNSQGFTYTGSGTSIIIDTAQGASGSNDVYNGSYLYTKNSSGLVQEVVTVTDYDGGSRTLTLSGSVSGSLRAYISPKVTATGDGSNLVAIARMSSNSVREIQIFTPGSGYSECTISFAGGGGSGAAAEAIISPFGGHGSDPVVELGAFNLLTKAKFEGDEGGVIVSSNEYRKIGLITNPLVYGSLKTAQARVGLTTSQMTLASTDSSTNDIHNGKKIYIYSGKGRGQLRTVEDYVGSTKLLTVSEPFDILPDNTSSYGFLSTDSVINQCLVLNYSSISGPTIQPDTTIYQGTPGSETAIGTVVQHDTVNNKVYITNLSKSSGAVTTYPYFGTISTTTGTSTFTTTSVNNVGVHPNTGTVLYVENRTPLSRFVEQIEDIRVIIQF
jgi:hypothetical protein